MANTMTLSWAQLGASALGGFCLVILAYADVSNTAKGADRKVEDFKSEVKEIKQDVHELTSDVEVLKAKASLAHEDRVEIKLNIKEVLTILRQGR